MALPKPKHLNIVCTECGLPWDKHKADAKGKVGLEECVRLLKAEVAKPKFYPYGFSAGSTTQWGMTL